MWFTESTKTLRFLREKLWGPTQGANHGPHLVLGAGKESRRLVGDWESPKREPGAQGTQMQVTHVSSCSDQVAQEHK